MANLNRIILVGRLTANPEARATTDSLVMSKFRLSVDRPQGGADFFDVVAWRRLAEVCNQYLKKGQLVLVDGRIQNRSFEDQTGQRRWATEIVAGNMQMLEQSRIADRQSSSSEGSEILESRSEINEEIVDDSDLENDLPF